MAVRVRGRWWTSLAPLLPVAILSLSAACGGGAPTANPGLTALDADTASPTGAPRAGLVPPPAAASQYPTETLSATPLPSPTATFAPTLLPQTAALKLEVTSPGEDTVVRLSSIYGASFLVAGLASPDATVSVNGILAVPDEEGRFSVELPLSARDNPLSIEVIATSVAGEQSSVVRTVILLP